MSLAHLRASGLASIWVVIGTTAGAQEAKEGPPDEGRSGYISPINDSRFFGLFEDATSATKLLTSPAVDELKLTADQVEKLKSIYEPIARRNIPLMRRLRSAPSTEVDRERLRLRAEVAASSANLETALVETLDHSQRARLQQITLQVGDPSALLTDPWTRKRLDLSDLQRDKFKTIVAEMWVNEARLKQEHRQVVEKAAASLNAVIQDGEGQVGARLKEYAARQKEERRQAVDQTVETRAAVRIGREGAIRKMSDALNPEQLATLHELLGRPYDVASLRGQNDAALTPVSWWHGTKEDDERRDE